MIGRKLNHYRILEPLGKGGMGEVFLAEDTRLGRNVALKVLPEETAEPGRLERFRREARALARLDHPNIVTIHSVEEADGVHFLTMALVEGETLDRSIPPDGLALDRFLGIAIPLADALAAAHAEEVIHRDLKPGNLMIDKDGRPKLLDFGLATPPPDGGDLEQTLSASAAITGAGEILGTVPYMSPEQARGEPLDARTDVFSLGILLFQMATGQHPFPRRNAVETLSAILTDPAPAVAELRTTLPSDVGRIVARCLEKQADRRFQTALDVRNELELLLGDTRQEPESSPVLKTLVASQPVASAAAQATPRHDDLVRVLMRRFGGRWADRAVGSVVLFDRPAAAVRFALKLHDDLAELATGGEGDLATGVGIHLGEVILGESLASAHDAGSASADELAVRTTTRLASLAGKGQTLLSRGAFDLARGGAEGMQRAETLRWLAHGSYRIAEIEEPIEVFEVGREGASPLAPPADTARAKRLEQDEVLGWRPAPSLEIQKKPDWRLQEKVGEGGFGEVWLAQNVKTHERHVFKFCFDAARLRALQREITIIRLLKEELGDRGDITRIVDWHFEEAPYFIESEYSEGGSLLEWAEARGGLARVPLETRLDLVAQIAEALAAAHSVGVLHKDVKPANVLVTGEASDRPRVQLTDFGVGSATDEKRLQAAGITVQGMTDLAGGAASSATGGTQMYLAPEIVEGRAPTVQADIYALGVVLYQMIAMDFSRALAPGWERDVEDDLLLEDVAVAVDRSSKRRLGNVLRLAERLRSLDERRRQRDAEERRALEVERTRAALERARQRRKATLTALAALTLFVAGLAGALVFAVDQRRKAEESLASLLLEQGRYESRYGSPAEALLYLSESCAIRCDNPLLRSLLAVNLRRLPLTSLQGAAGVFDPQGLRIATAGPGDKARIWAAGSGELIAVLEGHTGKVRSVEFEPGGRRVVTAGDDATARLWDAASGDMLAVLEGHEALVNSAAFDDTGGRVVTGGDDATARIWDTKSGVLLATLEGHLGPVISAKFDGAGQRILTVGLDGTARVWDAATGAPTATLGGLTYSVLAAFFDQSGMRVVTTCDDSIARVWTTESGRLTVLLEGHTGPVTSAAIDGVRGRVITTSFDQTARLWALDSGEPLGVLDGHQDRVWSAAFDADGDRIVTAGSDQTARVWDASSGDLLATLEGHAGPVRAAVFDASGRRVLTAGSDDSVRIWSTLAGSVVRTLDGRTAGYAPAGHRIVTTSADTAQVFDADSGDLMVTLAGHDDYVSAAAFDALGERIVTSSGDGMARIWRAASGALLTTLDGHADAVLSAAFDPTGRRVVTASYDETARVWDAESGALLATIEAGGPVVSAVFDTNGERILTAGNDLAARIWEVSSGLLVATLEDHTEMVNWAAYDPQSRRIVTASSDHTGRVWDARSGTPLVTLKGHSGPLSSAVFDPTGRWIVTAALDRTARVWDAESGTLLATLQGHTRPLTSAAFGPEGKRVVTAGSEGAVRVWDLDLEIPSPREIREIVREKTGYQLVKGRPVPLAGGPPR